MKRKKLLHKLSDWFDMEGRKQRTRREELVALLAKLKAKQEQLEAKMLREKREHKRKRLKKDIDIVRVQHRKGETILKKLEEEEA